MLPRARMPRPRMSQERRLESQATEKLVLSPSLFSPKQPHAGPSSEASSVATWDSRADQGDAKTIVHHHHHHHYHHPHREEEAEAARMRASRHREFDSWRPGTFLCPPTTAAVLLPPRLGMAGAAAVVPCFPSHAGCGTVHSAENCTLLSPCASSCEIRYRNASCMWE